MTFAPPLRRVRQPCDVVRAFHELLGRPWPGPRGDAAGCSPDSPELRDFPAPKRSGENYALCNGHLRDLFDAIAAPPNTPAPAVGVPLG